MSRLLGRFLPGLLPVLFVLVSSCGDDKTTTPNTNPQEADSLVAAANAALEDVLYELENGDPPERPADVDFTPAYILYQAAYEADPNNLHARFGLAITGLLVLTSDAEVNAAFDEWKAYLDAHTPFEVNGSAQAPLGIPLLSMGNGNSLRLPFELVPMGVLAEARGALALADPQISRVQDIFRDRVIPRAATALTHLAKVGADPNYVFIVTPRMQGDVEEMPRELDRSDVLVMTAACRLLSAACRVAISYDLNLAAYDSLSLYQAIQPESDWLGLAQDGALQMRNAKTEILASVDNLDAAITSLLAETDDQENDVIKIGPDDVSRADLDSIQTHLPDVRLGLTTGYSRRDDWDFDDYTPPTVLTINAGALFDHPVSNWKTLLPDYTGSLRRAYTDLYYSQHDGTDSASVTIPIYNYYSAYYYVSVYDHVIDYEYFSGLEDFHEPMRQVIMDRLAQLNSDDRWTGNFSAQASMSQYLEQGTQSVPFEWYTSYSRAETIVVVPVLTWEATSFEEWVWPDPTLGGLLPQMDNTNELLTTFGITAEDWEHEVDLDWTQ